MQEYSTPGEVVIADDDNLTASVWEAERTSPGRAALAHREGNRFVETSAGDFAKDVRRVAAGFIAAGIQPGSRICLMSPTRLEWTLLDYSIWAAGCVTVPIYETSSTEQVEWIVSNSEAVGIVIADQALKTEKFDPVASGLTGCEHIWIIDDGAIDHLKDGGKDLSDDDVMARANAVGAADEATLVYTSGTTGRPKGCVISHRSFLWDAAQVQSVSDDFFKEGASTLLFLPLAHIFARVIQVGCIRSGITLAFSTGIPQLLEELSILKPDFLLAVPRVFEKVYNGAKQKAHDDGKGKIFDAAVDTAVAYSREQAAGSVGMATKLKHALFDRLVYGKLRDALGGNVNFAVSGGAALGERLGHFFNGIGVTILEGYGLTETTAGATLNHPDAFKIGTVGKPLPGAAVRIAEDGEILLKGANVFEGYFANEEATKEAIDAESWFHTGDLGSLDNEGYLKITGRKKEIIVTAGGKNVAPAVLEDRMRSHPLVSQAMVIGDNQPFIAALVTIDPEAFPGWAEKHGKSGKSVADLTEDAELKAEVEAAIADANNAVSKAESIRAFRILPQDFEVGDELSQKMSVKRHVVSEKYGTVIDEIYAGVNEKKKK